MSELTQDDVRKILQIIDEMGERDVHLEIGDLKLHVSRSGGAAAAATVERARAPPARSVAPAAPAKSNADFAVPDRKSVV